MPALFGGSADLDPSTHTALKGQGDFNPPLGAGEDSEGSDSAGWSYAGRNVHFGVREHAMGAIVNGLAAHGGFIPYGSTFLIFSDYMRPSIRLAALMGLHVVHVFTHDSLALGEDGPTHQPVEQLASLRAIPGLTLLRPADANETAVAWKVAIETRDRPVLLALSRQDLPTLDRTRFASAEGVRRGAYVLSDAARRRAVAHPDRTGSEVALVVAAAERLSERGRRGSLRLDAELGSVRARSRRAIANEVLPPAVKARLAVELGVSQGWERYVGDAGDVVSDRPLRRVCAGSGAAEGIRLHASTPSSRERAGCSPAESAADASTAPGERLRRRFPLGPNVARPAAPFVRLLRPRIQPRQRAGPRQDRARLARQHRRHGHGAHGVPGGRRAPVHRPRRSRRARR